MLVNKNQVQTFIPQKSPFVMVDALIESNHSASTSQLLITKDNIFCKAGVFHEPGLIENIAQTAALAAGYSAKANKKKIGKGFIGAVKRLKIFHLPVVGECLTTDIHVLHNIMNASIIKGEIKVNDILIAAGEMTIFTGE